MVTKVCEECRLWACKNGPHGIIPEDGILQSNFCENLKSYRGFVFPLKSSKRFERMDLSQSIVFISYLKCHTLYCI
jgi:hypothetical protein